MSISPTICFALIFAFVVTACDSDDEVDNSEIEAVALLNQAAVVGDYAVLVDKGTDRVFSIDVSAKESKLAKKLEVTDDIAPNPYWIEAREGDEEEVLILSSGRRGVSQKATLTAMEVDSAKLREYEIDAPYDRLLQSSNGGYALLYFSNGPDNSVYSLNEIAVVNLDEDEDDEEAVARQAIDTVNGTISQIEISPMMKIGKSNKTVAVALSESRATIVDLGNADRNHTIVSLGGNSDESPILPKQVEFSDDEEEIYVRARNSNDIFVLALKAGDKEDFKTEVSQVPVGLDPSDMAVYKDGKATKLVVVSKGSNDVHIVSRSATDEDLPEGVLPQTVDIELDSEAEQVAVFEVAVSKDKSKNIALLYKRNSSTVTLLDLEDAEIYGEQNLDTISLREPVLDVERFEKNGFALITHQSSRIDVVDLASSDVSTIQIDGSLQNAIYNTDNPRFWILSQNRYFISYIDLDTGIPNNEAVLLDSPIMQLVVVEDAEKVVAVHEHKVCNYETDEDDDADEESDDDDEEEEWCEDYPISISILDYDKPSRDDLIQFSDFF